MYRPSHYNGKTIATPSAAAASEVPKTTPIPFHPETRGIALAAALEVEAAVPVALDPNEVPVPVTTAVAVPEPELAFPVATTSDAW